MSVDDNKRSNIQDALRATRGLEKVVRPRGLGKPLKDGETAEAWAKAQAWFPRLVRVTCDARNWCWWVRKEGT